jgi:hypothetical protein
MSNISYSSPACLYLGLEDDPQTSRALSFGVSLAEIKYYNAIGTQESLQIGDWLLIPRPRLVPRVLE